MRSRILFLFVIFASISMNAQISIVPKPLMLDTISKSSFNISQCGAIYTDEFCYESGIYFHEYLKNYVALNIPVLKIQKEKRKLKAIYIEKSLTASRESYTLDVNKSGIRIQGDEAGVFYGVQSLVQLMKSVNSNTVVVPWIHLSDAPRFSWRGLHLDVSRHFMPVSFIKKYIDLMAHYKLNVFHWHLTDNEGWRIQIRKYPKLTEMGSNMNRWSAEGKIRKYTHLVEGANAGFYTQDEIKDVIQFAKDRHIMIVPEIEMPGHSEAALFAYPELAVKDTTGKAVTHQLKYVNMYEPGEATFKFLEDVLTEIIALFPSPYVHIGGDEADMGVWLKSPVALALMKAHELKNERELQSYFIRRIEIFLSKQNKKLIGWDEILEGGLAPSATVMSWRGEAGGIAAAKMKHEVVMTPVDPLYFDYYQGDPKFEPPAFSGLSTLKKVYQYNPIPKELNAGEAKYVLGAQANVWTESIPNFQQVEYMAYPRVLALAEICWTQPQHKNWNEFEDRLNHQFQLLKLWNVNFRLSDPEGLFDGTTNKAVWNLSLSHPDKSVSLYYTLDGTLPGEQSLRYERPVAIDLSLHDSTVINVLTTSLHTTRKRYSSSIIKRIPSPMPVSSGDKNKAARYSFYETGIASCKMIDELTPQETGTLDSVYLPMKFLMKPAFAMKFESQLEIKLAGDYRISMASDDGSVLYMNKLKVIDNDGYHGTVEKTTLLYLEKGNYPITLYYFDGGGGKFLKLEVVQIK